MEERSFEDALKRIEGIISSLEEGDLPLKSKIEKFKEGAELLRFCNKEIREAEMSIQKIVDKDGKIKLEEFE